MNPITRRKFIEEAGLLAAATVLAPRLGGALEAPGPLVVAVHGRNPAAMLKAGMEKMGGWSAFVKRGRRVVLKPNAAWACEPEKAANTTPELVEEFIRECLKAGASEVVVPENPCSPAVDAFRVSGVGDAVKRAGGRMYCPRQASEYRKIDIPKGRSLKSADVVADVLEAECLVNMPVAKNHGSSAVLTIAMKNWMGSVKDRGYWHKHELHQCIADICTVIRPTLVIVDAMRIMLTNGPRGPGKLKNAEQMIFATDQVAADAYTATLFDKKPFDIPYIRAAHDAGAGCGDLAVIKVEHVNAA